jgi:hypothetical protein
MAAGNIYRSTGMPMRNIIVLTTAKIAPAMPPLTGIFAMLICGLRVSSLMLHLLALSYHKFTPPEVPRYPKRDQ